MKQSPGEPPGAQELERWIVSELSARVGIDPSAIDRRERFNRFGLDSMKAAAFTAALSQFLNRPLPPTLVWDNPSVDRLVAHLAQGSERPASPPPSPAQRPGPARQPSAEPIAVVGLACRFPGAPDAAAYWHLLENGIDAIREVPADRWRLDRLFDPDVAAPGKMSTRWGGFLDHIDRFDAQAFGISPREAVQMDPQQRLILELCNEALDDAGILRQQLSGTPTGVFIGAMWSDYARLIAGAPSGITQHTATGQDTSIIAARVSYSLGLQGPSLVVNTACSSSLVAVHLACQSLRAGESALAIAGGVNLISSPESTIAMSKFGAMAPDGRSKAFDARANGYVRGEGGGALILKPLSRALVDGDPVYCVILGSAVNNDGFSNGLTAPNPRAQEEVLALACARAGVRPDEIQYVETHGTGTLLGDPIEAGALGAVLGAGRPPDRPLVIGSVKTNVGHLEAAAGMAGFIKVALAIRHRMIPSSLHFERPNPHIDFDRLRLRVQSTPGAWPTPDQPALAGISSFGFGGTNSHVVVKEFRSSLARVLPLSADSMLELRALAAEHRARVSANPRFDIDTLCSRAAVAEAKPCRAAFTFASLEELLGQLDGFLREQTPPFAAIGTAGPRRVVFVCSGQGSQWQGMERELLRRQPVFRSALRRVAQALGDVSGWDLFEELNRTGPDSRLAEVDIVQPVLFAMQVALASLWRWWGVEPSAVVGHSMGEVAAAHVAGILSLEDAARVICHRSRLLKRIAGQGGMALVGLSAEAAAERLAKHADRLWVAASNSPASTVVAGDPAALREYVDALSACGVFARHVRVDVASHSPQVEPLRADLFHELEGLNPQAGSVPMYSTVSGVVEGGRQYGRSYWVRNLREPVQFARAVRTMLDDGLDCFLELSPHPILAEAIGQTIAATTSQGLALPSFRRDEDERRVLLQSAGSLFSLGVSLEWKNVMAGRDLPGGSRQSHEIHDEAARSDGKESLVALSAHSPEALRARAQSIALLLRETPALELNDLSYTTNCRRTHLEHRLAITATSTADVAAGLEAFSRQESYAGLSIGRAAPDQPRRLVGVFSGFGPQWWAMGRDLLRREPAFRNALQDCARCFNQYASWSLLEELTRDQATSRLDRMDIGQPALFALQVALAALWRSWGVSFEAVIGHSMGEVAAAHVAGVLSLSDAARVIFHRGRIVQQTAGQGRMAATELTADQARELVSSYRGRVDLAVINGPRSTVLSGEPAAIEEIVATLDRQGVFCRLMRVDFASHCPQMEPLQRDLCRSLEGLGCQAAKIPIVSTVRGRFAEGWEFDEHYWALNVREPVTFAAGVGELLERGFNTFVELNAHPVVCGAIADCAAEKRRTVVAIPSLRREQPERFLMLSALGTMYTAGHEIAWPRIHPDGGQVVPLPPYPWQRDPYWIETPARDAATVSAAKPGLEIVSPLLGARIDSPLPTFESRIGLRTCPFIGDHRLAGVAIVPAAAYIEMGLSAASEALGPGAYVIEDLEVREALVVDGDVDRTVQLVLSPAAKGSLLQIFSLVEGEGSQRFWRLHASGHVRLTTDDTRSSFADAAAARESLDEIRARCTQILAANDFYSQMRSEGLDLGGSFRRIEQIWRRDGEALGLIDLSAAPAARASLDSTMLDACLHLVGAARHREDTSDEYVWVMVGLDTVVISQPVHGRIWSHVRVQTAGAGIDEADVTIFDETGKPIGYVGGMQMRRIPRDVLARISSDSVADCLYQVEWRAKALENVSANAQPDVALPVAGDLCRTIANRSTDVRAAEKPAAADIGLDALAIAYVARALEEIGCDLESRPEAATLGVVERHRRFFERLLEIASEAPPGGASVPATLLLERHPEYEAEISLLKRCGERLAAVLRGECDPLQLIFPDGSLADVRRLYEDAPFSRGCNRLVRDVVQEYVSGFGRDRRFRLLEIGAGTGATTAHVLPSLPADAEYVFTDVSPLFLTNAKARFGDRTSMAFQLFDVERPPADQGLLRGQFDVVIAANVLHATSRLKETVDHVRQLLRPGGLLVLIEGVGPTPWIDAIFGMTPGWWKFTDREIRTAHPLLAPEGWHRVLRDAGFSSVETLTHAPAEHGSLFAQAVIVASASADEAGRSSRRWIVVPDREGVGAAVCSNLEANGDTCVLLTPPASGPWDDALAEIDRPGTALGGVLYFAGLDAATSDAEPGESIEAACASAAGGVLPLVRFLATRARSSGPLWIVTRGAQAADPRTSSAPVQAILWGLGRVVAVEHPEIWGGLVDVDGEAPDAAALVCAEILAGDGEREVAYRRGSRLVPRLSSLKSTRVKELQIRSDATYLITGGLGDLGLEVARWLVVRGARYIALVGRTPLPPRGDWQTVANASRLGAGIRAIEALEADGAEVRYVDGDIADRSTVASVDVMLAREGFPPIRGVVHTAGVIDDRPVADSGVDHLQQVIRPKVGGAWQLHQHFKGVPLDFFVLFSSIGSLLGHAGQGGYAAANAFLDALAHYRAARGEKAISINWPGWRELGFAKTSGGRLVLKDLEHHGIGTLRAPHALEIMGWLINQPVAQAVAAPINVERVRQTATGDLGILASLVPDQPGAAASDQPVDSIRTQLESAPPDGARRALLETYLKEQLARVLSTSPSRIDDGRTFGMMGLDSLLALELCTRLESSLNTKISTTFVFNHPTVRALASYVALRLNLDLEEGSAAPAAPRPTAATIRPDLAAVSDLSDDEAMKALLGDGRGKA